ncbi:MAG TPA: hypothetical protein VFM88_16350 [Vicinamibacteria bacterium]|nr:hypothetical protein [Vicinamibacteria bacterium]
MRLRFLLLILGLAAVAGTAEAGILDAFKRPGGLPKPVSYVGERVARSNVPTQTVLVRHPPKQYSEPGWGSRFDQIKHNYPPRPLSPPLRRREY